MNYQRLKKGLVSLAMTGAFALSLVAFSSTQAQAQGRSYRQWERQEHRQQRRQIRRWQRQNERLRQPSYRYRGNNRISGYYDRFGRFHAYGYYDRLGRFHRY